MDSSETRYCHRLLTSRPLALFSIAESSCYVMRNKTRRHAIGNLWVCVSILSVNGDSAYLCTCPSSRDTLRSAAEYLEADAAPNDAALLQLSADTTCIHSRFVQAIRAGRYNVSVPDVDEAVIVADGLALWRPPLGCAPFVRVVDENGLHYPVKKNQHGDMLCAVCESRECGHTILVEEYEENLPVEQVRLMYNQARHQQPRAKTIFQDGGGGGNRN